MSDIDLDLAAFLGDAPAAPTPTPTGVKPPDVLSLLDDIAASKPKGKRKTYPQFPDEDGIAAGMARKSLDLADAADQLATNNKLLGSHVLPFWMNYWSGKAETESGVRVEADQGAVLVICQAKLKKLESDKALDPVRHILKGKEADLFHWTFGFSIDGEEIPPVAQAALVTELKALFAKHGAAKALEVKKEYKAYPAFHTQRHVLFTAKENMEINGVLPIVTQVKTKDIS